MIREYLFAELLKRKAVLSSEIAKMLDTEGVHVAKVAKEMGYAVRQIGRVYVIAVTESDLEDYLTGLYRKLMMAVKKRLAGCRSHVCCVKLKHIANTRSATMRQLYLELLKSYGNGYIHNILYNDTKGYRICFKREVLRI